LLWPPPWSPCPPWRLGPPPIRPSEDVVKEVDVALGVVILRVLATESVTGMVVPFDVPGVDVVVGPLLVLIVVVVVEV